MHFHVQRAGRQTNFQLNIPMNVVNTPDREWKKAGVVDTKREEDRFHKVVTNS
ncbi:hypothetical protein JF544_03590 [Halobacillus kuroshimensis]|uniref:Uncharacterized protein n=2 Tax=Halobacillus kuroshimensis TaxID=302481 RepID=A0ABS3DSJ2_9BACI|nr:hypothetical protein [Halobacillus kuroshimensis]